MTLKEAHESGQHYRRRGENTFYKIQMSNINIYDAIADDYELEPIPEKTVTITRTQLLEAIIYSKRYGQFDNVVAVDYYKLCRKLGLED